MPVVLPRPAPFSDAEMLRRRTALLAVAAERGADRVVLYGAERGGTAVPWITRWAVTREAAVVVGADERDTMFVHFHNHIRLASELARDADVRWGGASTIDEVVAELERRGGAGQRIGMVGTIPYQLRDALADRFAGVVDLTADYEALRMVKSDEELVHLRYGAALSDAALEALVDGIAVGRSDYELIDRVERAYVPLGGTTHIHYLSITPMAAPDRPVPAQQPVGAKVQRGSVLVTELSAAIRGYSGQVLRTIVVDEEPNALYADLHDVALRAYTAVTGVIRDGVHASELHAAASLVTQAGYRLNDDLVHGFGGGYLPPVIGRLEDPVPDVTLRSGMTIVVQPNVMTMDGTAGVQTGELVLVTDDGFERLHTAELGLVRASTAG
jgi:Xaa-Pro dipeptidase